MRGAGTLRIAGFVLVAAMVAPGAVATGTADPGFEPPADHVICPPDSIGPPLLETSAATQGLPFRLVVPGLARQAAPEAVSPGLLALQVRLAQIVVQAPVDGVFAVAVTDLQTQETVGVGLDRPHYSGCIANLFVIIAALRDVDDGLLALGSVDLTIRQTIWASDATAARELYQAIGGGDSVEGVRRVGQLYDELGMFTGVLDHPPAFPGESLGINASNYLTAREVNGALARIYAGHVLSPASTAYLLDAMTGVKPGLNYLTGVLPDPAVVSHKNGFFWTPDGWVDNDTAIVRFGPNLEHAYAITFFSEAVPDLYADIPVGQALVFEAWEYFSGAYP